MTGKPETDDQMERRIAKEEAELAKWDQAAVDVRIAAIEAFLQHAERVGFGDAGDDGTDGLSHARAELDQLALGSPEGTPRTAGHVWAVPYVDWPALSIVGARAHLQVAASSREVRDGKRSRDRSECSSPGLSACQSFTFREARIVRSPLSTDAGAVRLCEIARELDTRFTAGGLTHDFEARSREEVADILACRPRFTSCGPWLAGRPNPNGAIRHAECLSHGGRSRTAVVNLANERCGVARRRLPVAR